MSQVEMDEDAFDQMNNDHDEEIFKIRKKIYDLIPKRVRDLP
jgi:hypothetical protein